MKYRPVTARTPPDGTWEDTSSYSRNEDDRSPKSFTIRFGKLRLNIIKGHLYFPEHWSAECDNIFGIRAICENTEDSGVAKQLALAIFAGEIFKIQKILDKIADGETS